MVCNSTDSKVHGTNMGPSGADRTQVGPMLAPWTLLSGYPSIMNLAIWVLIYYLSTLACNKHSVENSCHYYTNMPFEFYNHMSIKNQSSYFECIYVNIEAATWHTFLYANFCLILLLDVPLAYNNNNDPSVCRQEMHHYPRVIPLPRGS